jgi:hypothetical protein
MKYLKKFENFDLGRFSREEDEENAWLDKIDDMSDRFDDEEDILPGDIGTFDDKDEDDFYEDDEDSDLDDEREMRRRVWGDELVEGLTAKQKKLPKALQDAILKKKGKKADDKEDKKSDKKEEPKKGLTAAQKKLPKPLQDAILKKQKK